MDRCSCCSKELVPGKYIILGNGVLLCDSCMDVVVKSKKMVDRGRRESAEIGRAHV